MSKFDFMSFGYGCGDSDAMFVAHAKKYTAEETVNLCKRECDCRFFDHVYGNRTIKAWRMPTVEDVQDAHCAFRFCVSSEWPDGCYTLVGDKEAGAFPVRVIDFERLRQPAKEATHE